MVRQVELSSLDLRYENYRLKNPGFEKVILASILQYGLNEPLQGIDTKDRPVLLDGIKRCGSTHSEEMQHDVKVK